MIFFTLLREPPNGHASALRAPRGRASSFILTASTKAFNIGEQASDCFIHFIYFIFIFIYLIILTVLLPIYLHLTKNTQ